MGKTTAELFWEKVDRDGPPAREGGTCWLWTGSCHPCGYGAFWSGERQVRAHRWSYERTHGPIPEGLTLDHLCRNRRCVNPDHLEPVTNRENIMRGDGVTAKNARKTHCKHGHEFTVANTVLEKGKRNCRACRTLRLKRTYEVKRAALTAARGSDSDDD